MKYLIMTLVIVLASAWPADAQQVNLTISNGRVTLDATNVPVRQILSEWSRVGDTKVVGAEKITGAPLTLKFVDMPERQALDIILRNVAGFIAAPRRAAGSGASSCDRILVMATSTVTPDCCQHWPTWSWRRRPEPTERCCDEWTATLRSATATEPSSFTGRGHAGRRSGHC